MGMRSGSGRIASGILVVAGGCMVNVLFAAAFMPSTAIHDGHMKPTSHSYTNGDVPFSPFADIFASTPPARRLTTPHPQQAEHPPKPHDQFEVWGKLRLGLGTGPGASAAGVFWVGEGSLYEQHSGKILANFEGFDVARGVDLGDGRIRQISRKVFWFLDPITGKAMTEYEGSPVRPIKYESQVIEYFRSDDGSIGYSVEASKRPLKGKLPEAKVTSKMIGPHQMAVNAPVFVDIPLPEERGGGRYRAWEFYDFQVDPSFPPDRPPTLAWTRQGPVPPFGADSGAVMKFTGYRVDRFEDIPERMREEVERAHPSFQRPPMDEEIGVRL